MSDCGEAEVIRVGSRKSELALIQTRYVISLLKKSNPNKEFEIITMSTLGDRVLNISLPKIGEKSLFTKDLEEALENGSVDFVVHSLKDLPTSLPCGMAIGAVLEREDPRDALVLRQDFKGHTLETLPKGSIIGTSSLRRTAQLSRNYPHLKVLDIRGNLNTRLKKLDHNCRISNEIDNQNGNCDANGNGSLNDTVKEKDFSTYPDYAAIMLAQAGLVRMGWQHRISQVLPCKDVLYAVGQGALAVECRANNNKILEMLAPLNHDITYCRILAERSFLKTLGGGCSAPVAISTSLKKEKDKIDITGAVWSLDGKTEIQKSLMLNFEPTEWDNKIKHGKHKLSNAEIEDEISTNSKVPKKACMGLTEEIDNEVSKPLCCRQKTMNMTMEKVEPVEIENLINIHGKLFMSCPFSGKKGACPVKLEIGADFMGECPYQAAKDKGIDEDIKNTLVKLHPKRPSYDIKKCPFMSNQIVPTNLQTEYINTIDIESKCTGESKAANCPFLKQENLPKLVEESISSSTNESFKRLYCGLTKHFDIPVNIIEKCEDLGKRLAQNLIDEGALEVMKCSQDFIRGSVATSTIVNA